MLIYFVRHGQTEHNLQGIIQGQMDTPLNDTGRAESQMLADHIAGVPFTEAWSSDLSRAMETAQIITAKHGDLQIRTHPGLKERDLGSLSGKRWVRGTPKPLDAESSADFRARVSGWLAHMLSAHMSSDPDTTILVVSHGAYLSCLLGVLLSPPYSFSARGVDLDTRCLNTCVMRVRVEYDDDAYGGGGGWRGRILGWGEVEHLGDKAVDVGVADDLRQSVRKVFGMERVRR